MFRFDVYSLEGVLDFPVLEWTCECGHENYIDMDAEGELFPDVLIEEYCLAEGCDKWVQITIGLQFTDDPDDDPDNT
jgi:hypothetical protein